MRPLPDFRPEKPHTAGPRVSAERLDARPAEDAEVAA